MELVSKLPEFNKAKNDNERYNLLKEIPLDYVRAQMIFDKVAEADPDIHKKNTQWLLNVILSGKSLLEDLEKAQYYLTVYERVKRLLPVEQRDLNKYKSFADLYGAIKEKEQEISKRESDRALDAEMSNTVTASMARLTPSFSAMKSGTGRLSSTRNFCS